MSPANCRMVLSVRELKQTEGVLATPNRRPATRSGTRLLKTGNNIRTVQELVGHKEVTTTMIDAHVLNRGPGGVKSPLDG